MKKLLATSIVLALSASIAGCFIVTSPTPEDPASGTTAAPAATPAPAPTAQPAPTATEQPKRRGLSVPNVSGDEEKKSE